MTVLAKYLVDANILLRFLLNDHPAHSEAARQFINRARKGEIMLEIPFICVTETVFTLGSFYKLERGLIARELIKIFSSPGIKLRAPIWLLDALEEYGRLKVSFGDACISAEARLHGLPVASFDRDFDALPGLTRFEPEVA